MKNDLMNAELQDAIKKAVQYIEPHNQYCENCKYVEERQNPMPKNSYYLVCNRLNLENGDAFKLGSMNVKQKGTCNEFQKAERQG